MQELGTGDRLQQRLEQEQLLLRLTRERGDRPWERARLELMFEDRTWGEQQEEKRQRELGHERLLRYEQERLELMFEPEEPSELRRRQELLEQRLNHDRNNRRMHQRLGEDRLDLLFRLEDQEWQQLNHDRNERRIHQRLGEDRLELLFCLEEDQDWRRPAQAERYASAEEREQPQALALARAETSSRATESENTTAAAQANPTSECLVCFDAPRNVVCVPCGHVCMCMRCADRVERSTHHCIVCRAAIQSIVQVFYA